MTKETTPQRTGGTVFNMKPLIVRVTCYLFLCFMMTGCATSDSIAWDRAWQQSRSGQCTSALSTIDSMDAEFKHKLTMKGIVYGNCYGDTDRANAYLTLAARYGETTAIDALAQQGKPVPAADLAGTSKRELSLGEAALLGISKGLADYNNNPLPTPTHPANTDTDCRRVSKDRVNCSSRSY